MIWFWKQTDKRCLALIWGLEIEKNKCESISNKGRLKAQMYKMACLPAFSKGKPSLKTGWDLGRCGGAGKREKHTGSKRPGALWQKCTPRLKCVTLSVTLFCVCTNWARCAWNTIFQNTLSKEKTSVYPSISLTVPSVGKGLVFHIEASLPALLPTI